MLKNEKMIEKDIKTCRNQGMIASYLILKQFMSKEKALEYMEEAPFFKNKQKKCQYYE